MLRLPLRGPHDRCLPPGGGPLRMQALLRPPGKGPASSFMSGGPRAPQLGAGGAGTTLLAACSATTGVPDGRHGPCRNGLGRTGLAWLRPSLADVVLASTLIGGGRRRRGASTEAHAWVGGCLS